MLTKGIGLENFKGIGEKVWIDFAAITVLTGDDEAGKNSVLEGLKVLGNYFENRKKQYDNGESPDIINAEDALHKTELFDELIFKDGDKKEFTLSLPFELDYFEDKLIIHLSFKPVEENKKQGILNKLCIYSEDSAKNIFSVERIDALTYRYEVDCLCFLDRFIKESKKHNAGLKSFFSVRVEKVIKKRAVFEYLNGDKFTDWNGKEITFDKPTFYPFNDDKDSLNKDQYTKGSKEYYEAAMTKEFLENFCYVFKIFTCKEDFEDAMGYRYTARSASRNEREDKISSRKMDKFKEGNYNNLFCKAGLMGIERAESYMAGGSDANGDAVNVFAYISDLSKFLSKNGNDELFRKNAADNPTGGLPVSQTDSYSMYEPEVAPMGKLPVSQNDEGKGWYIDHFFKYFVYENMDDSFDRLLNKQANIIFSSYYRKSYQRTILRNNNPLFEEFFQKVLALQDNEKERKYLEFVKEQFARFEIGDRIFGRHGFAPLEKLPLILEIAIAAMKNEQAIFVVDKPEELLNSSSNIEEFAEMLTDAIKTFGMKFIVNTNNEDFIEKLQMLNRKKRIKKGDAVVYQFNSGANEKQVERIAIEKWQTRASRELDKLLWDDEDE